ncbi:MAG TPA: DegT/DnrJ/EryC1/StrS family aminotransferase [Candidatus Latescibacteria bacterium]|nr:DegT/DnrJ/EryC1/StrS family aminotransferase [Candidatus Latescibacterota bacterium]
MEVPLIDLVRQYRTLQGEIDEAIRRVVESGRFIGGPEVEALEEEVARYVGVRYAIGVASGTDALWLSLMALGVGPEDEVITTPFTFAATAEAIALLGARPVFVDVDPQTYCIDPGRIEEAITPRTKAIVPVHLFGQPVDWEPIEEIAKRYGLFMIEDGAQAIGAEYRGRKACSLGHVGCLSFFPTKNLGAYGDGGMVTTDDPEMADRIKVLRVHGAGEKYAHKVLGTNSRLDAIQAAVLRAKLPHTDRWNARRREIAALYDELLREVDWVVTPYVRPGCLHVYHQYSVRVPDRDRVRERLAEVGVATAVHYPIPLHLQGAFRYLGYKEGNFPVAEKVSREVLSLPIFPELTDEEVRYVAKRLMEASGV